jgi:RNA polymerase sigma-70 factor (ECF subfamily)
MATREEHQRAPVDRSIALAKDGSFSALGQLLDQYRDYLLKVARGELGDNLAGKVAPSDLVQETFIQAVGGFPRFVGDSEADLKAWLRQILLHNIRDAEKFWNRRKRRVAKEMPLENPADDLPGCQPNASAVVRHAEDRMRLRNALAKLTAEHRQVIEMRSFKDLSFEEIGQAMCRSSEAARKLWTRAVDRLAELLADG